MKCATLIPFQVTQAMKATIFPKMNNRHSNHTYIAAVFPNFATYLIKTSNILMKTLLKCYQTLKYSSRSSMTTRLKLRIAAVTMRKSQKENTEVNLKQEACPLV